MKRVFLYSHGFATRADDNGLFSAIESMFPDDTHIMFAYDAWNGNTAEAAGFFERKARLEREYSELRAKYPDVEIDLICHSQGCCVAALAQLENVATTVMFAPSISFGDSRTEFERVKAKANATLLDDGSILRKRSIGDCLTLIKPNYWADFDRMADLSQKYSELAKKTRLLIIDALNDEVLSASSKDYSQLDSSIELLHLDVGHNMLDANGSRASLEKLLYGIFGESIKK